MCQIMTTNLFILQAVKLSQWTLAPQPRPSYTSVMPCCALCLSGCWSSSPLLCSLFPHCLSGRHLLYRGWASATSIRCFLHALYLSFSPFVLLPLCRTVCLYSRRDTLVVCEWKMLDLVIQSVLIPANAVCARSLLLNVTCDRVNDPVAAAQGGILHDYATGTVSNSACPAEDTVPLPQSESLK